MKRMSMLVASTLIGLATLAAAQEQRGGKGAPAGKAKPKTKAVSGPVQTTPVQTTPAQTTPGDDVSSAPKTLPTPKSTGASSTHKGGSAGTGAKSSATFAAPARTERSLPRTETTAAEIAIDHSSPGIAPTPEMWIYEQEWRRHNDPKQAVRRRAEFRAAQRQLRIASLKWHGLSNSRPVANPTPFTGSYANHWTSGVRTPFMWGGPSSSTVIISRRSGLGLW